uniref:Uncharacterized protein n=1 Tax=Rhizophora mucronata TaxID=61149 RepID=A0A2P2Q8D9_RHIMU
MKRRISLCYFLELSLSIMCVSLLFPSAESLLGYLDC